MDELARQIGTVVIELAIFGASVLIGRYIARRTKKDWLGVAAWAVCFFGAAILSINYGLHWTGGQTSLE